MQASLDPRAPKQLTMPCCTQSCWLLYRFDLLHIMIDEPDEEMDAAVARHIVGVHQRRERAFNVPYTMGQVQRYIKFARAITPRMTPEVNPANLHTSQTRCSY